MLMTRIGRIHRQSVRVYFAVLSNNSDVCTGAAESRIISFAITTNNIARLQVQLCRLEIRIRLA